MIDIKVSLTVAVPGAVPFSKQLCFKTSKVTGKHGETKEVETPIEDMTEPFVAYIVEGHGKNTVTKRVTLHLRKRQQACQVLNMSTQSYNYMTSADACPEWFRVPGKNPAREWRALKPIQRLELHLERVAADLGGVVADYSIMED